MTSRYDELLDEQAEVVKGILDYHIEKKGDEETVEKLVIRYREIDVELAEIIRQETMKIVDSICELRNKRLEEIRNQDEHELGTDNNEENSNEIE
ncbi:MAG: hypothetical protein IKH13_07895 [Clostridia bacterium]|nr:hypothetical protein [Clostridia bacterium]